ncbi:hypothetical protein BN6_46920 [Saccharothrix espanaensis DSM 44229]|uniref:Ribosomal RNA adenine methylase transferase N-terminal domain-containing protein n=1 Tax=Saccharothrix espanaensis (strain ATCC 51144 / DSM 44229 / JCM 9112 / NBRC 15066 / NRRL 15764) TaxID=1179773 RepID=K0K0U4_SACES|nr:hypothetical protein BN6_46920 [Saccharothrix espanaensis DSM 44229]
MRTPHPGRRELGQNFLIDHDVIGTIVDLVAATGGPIVEIGAGDGALTRPLHRLGRPLTAVEVDRRRAARLARLVGPGPTPCCWCSRRWRAAGPVWAARP